MAVFRFRLPSVSCRRWCGIALLVAALAFAAGGSAVRLSDTRVLIPVGGSGVVGPNRHVVVVDGQPWSGGMVADGYGGTWLDLGSLASRDAVVVLRLTVTATPPPPRSDDTVGGHWAMPSALIDSNDPEVVAAARRVTAGETSVSGKAEAIHDYVASNLEWRKNPARQNDTASTTLTLGHGTCANFARLFVALSRAVGIPARTIQGVVFDTDLDSYHQWAEYRDEEHVWHVVDPTTDTDPETVSRLYVDLVYSPEANTWWTDPNNIILYDTTHKPHDGRLGFRVVHETPTTATIENTYILDGLIDGDTP
ncbi:MAG: transglutaminase-like domain-containing protein [Acidimicrobiia bacterium]